MLHLRYLFLDDNEIGNRGLRVLCRALTKVQVLRNLYWLDISSNRFDTFRGLTFLTSALAPDLGNLPSLKRLHVDGIESAPPLVKPRFEDNCEARGITN